MPKQRGREGGETWHNATIFEPSATRHAGTINRENCEKTNLPAELLGRDPLALAGTVRRKEGFQYPGNIIRKPGTCLRLLLPPPRSNATLEKRR